MHIKLKIVKSSNKQSKADWLNKTFTYGFSVVICAGAAVSWVRVVERGGVVLREALIGLFQALWGGGGGQLLLTSLSEIPYKIH